MDPRQLLQALMDRDGDNPNSLAEKLRQRTRQPQIFKFLNGVAKEPRRSTLQPVADFYGISVDAFYDPAIALSVMENLKAGRPLMITGHAAATLPFTAAATGSTAGPTPPADYSPDALRLGKWFDKLPPDNVKTAQVYQDCMQLIINALHDLEQTPAPAPVARREKRPA